MCSTFPQGVRRAGRNKARISRISGIAVNPMTMPREIGFSRGDVTAACALVLSEVICR